MKTNHSRALHMAHILKANRPDFTWSDMVRQAWYFAHFREWLKAGIVTFSFFKKDGSIREARGTLHDLLIPADKRPKGIVNPHPCYSNIAFFDLEKNEWRSFDIRSFIGFVTVWELKEKRSKRENHAGA